jgi:hypothetical protein
MTGPLCRVGVVLLVVALVSSLLFVPATPAFTQPIKVRVKFGVSDRTPPKNEKIVFSDVLRAGTRSAFGTRSSS